MSNYTPKVIGAPDAIWLNYGEFDKDTHHIDICLTKEVDWETEKLGASDIKYVRADMLMGLRDALKDILRIARAASHGNNFNATRIERAEAAISKAEGVLND